MKHAGICEVRLMAISAIVAERALATQRATALGAWGASLVSEMEGLALYSWLEQE